MLSYIYGMRTLGNLWGKALSLAFFAVGAAWAAADSTSAVLDTTKNTSLGNVDIFGQNAVGSIYILWDNIDPLFTEVKKAVQEKSFATDEFFMQNIDREQFEEERVLRLFDDQKQQYFKLFPEDKKEDDDDDQ